MASTVGLVLLGIGSAAASIGPSPGPAAEPLPKAPGAPTSSAADTVVVDIDLPPLPAPQVAQEPPTLPSTLPATTTTIAAVPLVLPRTGAASRAALVPAWLAVITGTGLLAVRRSSIRSPRSMRRARPPAD